MINTSSHPLGNNSKFREIALTPNASDLPRRDIDHLMPHHVVEMGFVQAPEGKQLFHEMTVQDNLLVGSYNRRARSSRSEASLRLASAWLIKSAAD